MVKRKPQTHLDAVDRMVEALPTGAEHEALVQSARGLAQAIDALDGFDDKAWREYRLALKELREAATSGSDDDDDFDAEFDKLRAEVGDPTES